MAKRQIGVPLEGFDVCCRRAAAEGAVLLKNEREMLPLRKGERVALFGRIQKDYYRSGTGSGGAVNVAYTTNLLDSLRACEELTVDEELAQLYENWIASHPFDDGGGEWAAEPWSQEEMPVDEETVRRAAERADKALVVFGRTAGEAKDYEDVPGGYRLSEEELALLDAVTGAFPRTAVILNVSCIIDMSFLDRTYVNPPAAVLYVWHGGQEGGRAAADVITGQVSPCGKLADTIARNLADYPSSANHGSRTENIYQEDIYVGYRYFETFAPGKVRYPFGFGLSYTDFELTPFPVRVEGEQLWVRVRVKNTGEVYAGREVVQVYFGAPQGKLGRPVRELAGFAKTRLLAPGEEEEVTVRFPVSDMAAYDDGGYTGNKSCYVLESGCYRLWAGVNCRDLMSLSVTMPDGEITDGYRVEELRVTQRLEEACAPARSFVRLKPGSRKEDGTYTMEGEQVPTATVCLADRIADRMPPTLTYTGGRGIRLKDVQDGDSTMEAFVSQLSKEELAAIVRGEGMCSPRVTPGVASCFGGVTDALQKEYGIPVAAASDGPSGIRMDVGELATQVPIGTLLACTFDPELVEELYVLEGKELLRNEIDTLLGPGLNIHRNPLNGRNFEYFSEDPLLAGKMAAANVRGILRGGSHATIKHFACNSQELERNKVNALVSERALRQIYLKGFETAVKEGGCDSVMTSYNPVNGHWNASNYDLNTTILRGEWGFDGIVMTDWWATMNDCESRGDIPAPESMENTAAMVRSQNDLYMVVENLAAERNPMHDNTLEALAAGRLTMGELQRCAANICRFLIRTPAMERSVHKEDVPERIASRTAFQAGNTSSARELAFACRIETVLNRPELLCVLEGGIYHVRMKLRMDNPDRMAQSACNAGLNGVRFATPQLNGANGAGVEREMGRVELEAGYYELLITPTKMPGMEVEWVEFYREK